MSWPRVGDHLAVGASTGYMIEERGDWLATARRAAGESISAVELSALSEPELPGLLSWLAGKPALPFWWVAAHGPTKAREMPEAELVGLLEQLSAYVQAIVIHPDTIEDLELYRGLGPKIAIENMDTRKPIGQTADDLNEIFAVLADARLCFDVAHLGAVDASMSEGHEILDRFGSRLSHVHISSLDDASHHVPLTEDDEERFGPVLDRCRDMPWILEAPLPQQS